MSKINYFFIFFFSFLSGAFSAEETMTLTTYYPAPHAVFKTLKLNPSQCSLLDVPCLPSEEGEMCYNKAGLLLICNGTNWVAAPGGRIEKEEHWTYNEGGGFLGTSHYFNTALGNVRIGSGDSSPPEDSKGPGGYLEVNDIWLQNDCELLSELVTTYYWEKSPLNPNDIYNTNTGNVAIGLYLDEQLPTAKLDMFHSLVVINNLGEPLFRFGHPFDSGRRPRRIGDILLGIGTSNPLTELDLRGKLRIEDGTQRDQRVLASDSSGLAVWKELASIPLDPGGKASGGFYGWCREKNGDVKSDYPPKLPAIAVRDRGKDRCSCGPGYLLKRMGNEFGGQIFYACYKD